MTENEFLGIAESAVARYGFYWTWAWGGSTTIGVEICFFFYGRTIRI